MPKAKEKKQRVETKAVQGKGRATLASTPRPNSPPHPRLTELQRRWGWPVRSRRGQPLPLASFFPPPPEGLDQVASVALSLSTRRRTMVASGPLSTVG